MPDYFKLPFEVHYNEAVEITSLEFMSDGNVDRFANIKIVRQQQGNSINPSFICRNNSGPELYCCITNGHDQVQPDWLELLGDDDLEINYATNLKVLVDGVEIRFEELSDEELDEESQEYVDVESMDYCGYSGMMAFELEVAEPAYLILDASGTRIKVDLQGYVLDDDGEPTGERVFNPEDLHDQEELLDYSSSNMWEATADWVKAVINEEFPGDIKLSFGFN